MCHLLELIFNAYRFITFYLVGLAIYLFTFTIIYLIISMREFTFLQLWAIGSLVGGVVEVVVVREIFEIVPFLIVVILFWGLLYTAVNYALVRHILSRIGSTENRG